MQAGGCDGPPGLCMGPLRAHHQQLRAVLFSVHNRGPLLPSHSTSGCPCSKLFPLDPELLSGWEPGPRAPSCCPPASPSILESLGKEEGSCGEGP